MLPTNNPSADDRPNAFASATPAAFCAVTMNAMTPHKSATSTPPCRSPENFAAKPRPTKKISSSAPRFPLANSISSPIVACRAAMMHANTSPPITAGGMLDARSDAQRAFMAIPSRIARIARISVKSSFSTSGGIARDSPQCQPITCAGSTNA
jgi:hypothetical protein